MLIPPKDLFKDPPPFPDINFTSPALTVEVKRQIKLPQVQPDGFLVPSDKADELCILNRQKANCLVTGICHQCIFRYENYKLIKEKYDH